MLKIELEKRIGFGISEKEFKLANEQYMNCELDKDEFAKVYKKYYFSLHPERKEELKELKRRSNMSNKKKAIEDIENICKAVESTLPLNDFKNDIEKIEDDTNFDFFFLLRETGSELYLTRNEAFVEYRSVEYWKASRKALYHIVANEYIYNITLISEY